MENPHCSYKRTPRRRRRPGENATKHGLLPKRRFCDIVMDDHLQSHLLRGFFKRVLAPRNRAYFVVKVLPAAKTRQRARPVSDQYAWLRGSRWHWNNWND